MSSKRPACPNQNCSFFGVYELSNIVIHATSPLRWRCKECGKTFVSGYGTFFYRLRTPRGDILEIFRMLGTGYTLSDIVRRTNQRNDVILNWLKRAIEHKSEISDYLTNKLRLNEIEIWNFWDYVVHLIKKESSKPAS
jgi:transposase-like protein